MNTAYQKNKHVQLPRVHVSNIDVELVDDDMFEATELTDIPTDIEDPCSACLLNGTKKSLRTGFTASYKQHQEMLDAQKIPFHGTALTLRVYLAQQQKPNIFNINQN